MKIIDFDQMIQEMRAPKLLMRAFGESIELPAQLPALVALRLLRLDEAQQVPAGVLIELMELVYGPERVHGWVERPDCTLDMLAVLLKVTLEAIQGAPEGGQRALTEDDTGDRSKN